MSNNIDFESPGVQIYLGFLQAVISRMASNSASCKTWCITLISAIIVITAGKNNYKLIWITLLPLILFFILDSYYLSLERGFRERYNNFIKKLHSNSATIDDIYILAPEKKIGSSSKSILKACGSISVWPFYILFAVMLCILRRWIL